MLRTNAIVLSTKISFTGQKTNHIEARVQIQNEYNIEIDEKAEKMRLQAIINKL